MDLRTIQDWIVRRELSGIPGVVEINTWGGHLKQYEVALNPEQLTAMNVSISSIFEALEKIIVLLEVDILKKKVKPFLSEVRVLLVH